MSPIQQSVTEFWLCSFASTPPQNPPGDLGNIECSCPCLLLIARQFHSIYKSIKFGPIFGTPTNLSQRVPATRLRGSPIVMNLLTIPDEIFDLVLGRVGYLRSCRPSSFEDLKRLRFVCKRFARSYTVLSNLFHSVHLIADFCEIAHFSQEHLTRSGVAPYVRHITFVPPVQAPFTFEEYRDVFRRQAKDGTGCYLDLQPPGKPKPKAATRDHYLHTEEQLREGFEEYEASLNMSWWALESEDLRVRWIKILKQCTNATSFSFALVDYSIIGADLLPTKPDCFMKPIKDQTHFDLHCDDEMVAEPADDFVKVAIECITRAQCMIEILEFGQGSMHIDHGWNDVLDWDRLDLSNLKDLSVQPRLPLYLTDEDSFKQGELMQKDIHVLFKRASATLEKFNCRRTPSLLWEGTPIGLPKLQYLELASCYMSSKFFCTWLEAMPSLQTLIIGGEMSLLFDFTHEEEPNSNWRTVFDAMRDHTSLVDADFKLSTGIDGYDYAFCVNKTAQSPSMGGFTESPTKESLIDWLKQHHPGNASEWIPYYIRKEIEWCGALRDDFGGFVGADSDSDEWTSDSDQVMSDEEDPTEDSHDSDDDSE